MKRKGLFYVSMIFGIIVTLFMLVAFGPKFLESLKEDGLVYLLEVPKAFADWYDNPIAFFFTYFIGYAIIWWKALWGSVIIIIGDILFLIFNIQNMGTFIFIIPKYIAYTYIGYAGSEVISGGDGFVKAILIAIALLAAVLFIPRFITTLRRGR